MKKLVILAVLVLTPLSSFAIVDVEGYAGYNFLGKYTPSSSNFGTISGLGLGGRAHLTMSLVLVNFGIGAFADYRALTCKQSGNQVKMDRFSAGPDAYIRLDPQVIPIKPYLRGGMSFYDRYQTEVLNTTSTDKYYLKGYYFGIGASYNLVSLILVDVNMFVEYLYDISKLKNSGKINSQRVNLGLSLAL